MEDKQNNFINFDEVDIKDFYDNLVPYVNLVYTFSIAC